MNNAASVNAQIREFVTTNFYVPEPTTLQDDDSLLGKGIIDSTGVLELIGFLEQTFSIKVEDTEMVPENLDSIGRASAFVQRKLG